jgi:alkylation response protein AidB-like acyl-CoA dehydrogenase
MLKLFLAELAQHVYRLAIEILGADGLRAGSAGSDPDWHHDYLQSCSISIGGGTSEIMRNIIGERVLGLPR